MRAFLVLLISCFLLVCQVTQADCPPNDEDIKKMTATLHAPLKEICQMKGGDPGTKPAHIQWARDLLGNKVPELLGVEFPAPLKHDIKPLIRKCVKADLCNERHQEEAINCLKRQAAGLAAKYAVDLPRLCPKLDKIVKEWNAKHSAKALAYFKAWEGMHQT